MNVTLLSIQRTSYVERKATAFNLSESGIDAAGRWLKDQPYPPAGTDTFDPFNGAQSLGGGTYSVLVKPDPGNPGTTMKRYAITATGTFKGKTQRIEQVLRLQSFSRYAYFTDSETSSISGGRIWFFRMDKIRGPAHSNNTGNSAFQINWANSTGSIFDGPVTSAADRIDYSPRNPNTEADFLKIYQTGSRGYQLGVDPIPLPQSSDIQRNAAWGSSSGFPGSNGVYIPTNGGVYVRGDSSVTMSVDASQRQVFTIVQGSTTTRVTVDLAANQRIVQVGSNPPTTVPGAGTGVLYSTGNITSLSGTIADSIVNAGPPVQMVKRSAYTIATDVNNNKTVTVTNNIKYLSTPDPDMPVNSLVNMRPGVLGLVAKDIVISSGAPRDLEINAVNLAGSENSSGGSFYVQNFNTKTPTGTLKLLGGIIQKARGPVGTLNSSTGQIVSGYAKDYWYDPRLADFPPPFFPTTGVYDRVSWRRFDE